MATPLAPMYNATRVHVSVHVEWELALVVTWAGPSVMQGEGECWCLDGVYCGYTMVMMVEALYRSFSGVWFMIDCHTNNLFPL